jgi:hypothetical protein
MFSERVWAAIGSTFVLACPLVGLDTRPTNPDRNAGKPGDILAYAFREMRGRMFRHLTSAWHPFLEAKIFGKLIRGKMTQQPRTSRQRLLAKETMTKTDKQEKMGRRTVSAQRQIMTRTTKNEAKETDVDVGSIGRRRFEKKQSRLLRTVEYSEADLTGEKAKQ